MGGHRTGTRDPVTLVVQAGSELGEVLLAIIGGEEASLQRLADECGLPRTTLRHVVAGFDMTRATEGRIFAYLAARGFTVPGGPDGRSRAVTLEDVRRMHPGIAPPPVEPEWLRLQERIPFEGDGP